MAFSFRLEHEDGTPADPRVLRTAELVWNAGDTIPVSAEKSLRVIETRFEDPEDPVLVVESSEPGHLTLVPPSLDEGAAA